MRIINLIDNISYQSDLKSEHGLSYYIETERHKILFDTGQSSAFIENAKNLGVDLTQVDTVIISHGHYDHGGGLKAFLELNSQARVYIQANAFNPYYSKNSDQLHYIGLDTSLMDKNQIKLVDRDTYVIDQSLILYASIKQIKLSPLGNNVLVEKRGFDIKEDPFLHEQNLVIRENNHIVLMAGCAHNGVLNIVEQVNSRLKSSVTHVFGGFHLYNLTKDVYEDDKRILELGHELLKTKACFFTGHCTGTKAFDTLKQLMKDKIDYISVGRNIEI